MGSSATVALYSGPLWDGRRFARVCSVCLLPLLASCLGMPEGVEPVNDFDADRYLGRWYEIARLDHRFERGLEDVTATYSRRDDGAVRVLNRGYDVDDEAWSDIEGVARFVNSETEAYLKVSFFGPFYGSYVVFGLGADESTRNNPAEGARPEADVDGGPGISSTQSRYGYAFVSGFSADYLWLLSRTPEVSDTVREQFLEQSRALGFDTDELIWVTHQRQ